MDKVCDVTVHLFDMLAIVTERMLPGCFQLNHISPLKQAATHQVLKKTKKTLPVIYCLGFDTVIQCVYV